LSSIIISIDDKTSIIPIVIEKEQKIKQRKSIQPNNPVLIAGFPGPGLVGSISANYIIEQLHMHQIAYADSEYIMPSVMYI
jgi:uncharacterized protein